MSMSESYKEIPTSLLARLLERPTSSRWVDALLFEPAVGSDTPAWTRAASVSELSEAELDARFESALNYLPREERGRLGAFDLGSDRDWAWDLPFRSFLAAAAASEVIDLEPALASPADPSAWCTLADPFRFEWSLPRVDDEEVGIASQIVCYGINGYRTADELRRIWHAIQHALERYAEHEDALVERFHADLRYYEGCALRGSADLLLAQ